jgi:hypothetical protein
MGFTCAFAVRLYQTRRRLPFSLRRYPHAYKYEEISSASTRGAAAFTHRTFGKSLSLTVLKKILPLAMELRFHRLFCLLGPP